MRVKALILAGLILLCLPLAISAESNETDARSPISDRPSMELIEFLGDFGTERGEWIDPLDLEHAVVPDAEQDNEKSKI